MVWIILCKMNGEYWISSLQALDEVSAREVTIMDLQKRIVEGENRLKQQQNLYETVRSERNLLSKNLVDAQDEINELRRRIKVMNHQIEQMKEEINTKELALIKEHFDFTKVIIYIFSMLEYHLTCIIIILLAYLVK